MNTTITTKSVQIFKLGNVQVTQESSQHPLEQVFEISQLEYAGMWCKEPINFTIFVQFEPSRAIAYKKLLDYVRNLSGTFVILY